MSVLIPGLQQNDRDNRADGPKEKTLDEPNSDDYTEHVPQPESESAPRSSPLLSDDPVGYEPGARNPDYDGSPEAEARRMRAGRDRARRERDELQARVTELERLNLEAREQWAKQTAIIGDIEQIRTTEGNSVTIMCDNPEADTVEQQAAVDVCGDFTEWQEVRYWGTNWVEALRKAADVSRAFNAR